MTTKTMILGKDSALEDSIARMQGLLKNSGFDVEEASWLNPIPHVWSVHLRDRYCPFLFTNGKGATKNAALASALGEFFERLNCNYFFADYYLGEDIAQSEFVHYPQERWFKVGKKWDPELLDETMMKWYNPQRELTPAHLIDTNSGATERGICALPFIRQKDQKTVWVPINIVGNLYVSNGMSAGNTPTEARVQALSEIFERSIKNKIIAEGLALPTVPQSVINQYPRIAEAITKLEAYGFPIIVKDASLGGRYPVMNVTLLNKEDGSAFASFGAHPKFEVALERSLTELLQGRALDKLNVFQPPTFELDAVAEHLNIEAHFIDSNGLISWNFFSEKTDYDFVHWNFKGETTQEECENLLAILHQMDKNVYIADYEHLGVYGCRCLVPSLSEIYLADDLVWDNNNAANTLRPLILKVHSLEKKAALALYDELEEKAVDDMLLTTHFIGVIADANSTWASLRIGELKTWLALLAGDFERAKQGTEWCLHFAPLNPDRRRLILAVDTLLNFKLDEEKTFAHFENTFVSLYGEELLNKAQSLVEGKISFPGIMPSDSKLIGFEMHQKLLTSYQKLQKAKKIWWALKDKV